MSDPEPFWRRPRFRRLALTALLWAIVIGCLGAAWRVLLPFTLALLLAFVLEPLVGGLARRKVRGRAIPRWVAVIGVYLAVLLVVWGAALALVPRVYKEALHGLGELRGKLSELTPERIDDWSRSANEWLSNQGLAPDPAATPEAGEPEREPVVSVDIASALSDAVKGISTALRSNIADVFTVSRELVGGFLRGIFFFVLLFMVTAYLSIDAPRILAFARGLFPSEMRPAVDRVLGAIDVGLAGVVRGQLTICFVNGALTLAGLLVLRIPFAFALAAMATVLYIVPIFGTIISSVPIVLVGLTQGLHKGVLALLWILGIHALESYFLNPKVMGDASRVHPVLIVMALLTGEQAFGPVGALLAVPTLSILSAVFRELQRTAAELEPPAGQPGAKP